MREFSPDQAHPEPVAPADPAWVYSMLSEGMALPNPDPAAGTSEPSDPDDAQGSLLMPLLTLALLLTLMVAGLLT